MFSPSKSQCKDVSTLLTKEDILFDFHIGIDDTSITIALHPHDKHTFYVYTINADPISFIEYCITNLKKNVLIIENMYITHESIIFNTSPAINNISKQKMYEFKYNICLTLLDLFCRLSRLYYEI